MITNIKYIAKSFNSFLLLSLITLGLFSCAGKGNTASKEVNEEHHDEKGTVEFSEVQFKSAGITLGSVQKRQLSGALKANGLLDVPPQNQVSISVPYGGVLQQTDLLQGTWVNQGQAIAKMEHPDYIQMQQDYVDAASQMTYMEKEYKRQQELSRENVSAVKTFERTEADYNSLKSRVASLAKKLALLNINTNKLASDNIYESITLTSPISGYVTKVNANIGKFVQANEVIFEIVDTRHLHVELMVFEKDVPKLKVGQKVRYNLANESAEREAEIHLIGREITPERTVRVHCHMIKEDKDLLPGMFLKATVEIGTEETDALPNEAIVDNAGKKYFFIQIDGEEEHHTEKHEEGHDESDKEKEADSEHGKEQHGYKFKMIEVNTGVSDNGYTQITLPGDFDRASGNIVLKGAYDLLSKMNNSEEEGHGH